MIYNNSEWRRGRHAVRCAICRTALILLTASCVTETRVHPDKLPTGAWGGTDISMTATDDGATMTYSCGTAKISAPLTLDGEGNFSWSGTTKYAGGAPPPNGQTEPDIPSTFTGVASLSRLVLRVTPTGQPQNERVFTLMRGSPGVVYACP